MSRPDRTAAGAPTDAVSGHSSGAPPALAPDDHADRAVRAVYRALVEALLVHELDVRQDRDPEALHDFRVAVRRTRTGLGQLRGVLPAGIVEPFRAEFGWLGEVTGPKRDLDVLRLALPGLRDRLPEAVRADLDPLDAFLVAHQAVEQARLVAVLDGARYRALVDGWRALLDDPSPPAVPAPDTPDAGRPARDVADERIWKAYRRVRKSGRAIRRSSPPEALHALRIACKKLRYLVEFFRPLYPAADMRRVVADLKQLQDNLGAFNDTAVQQAALATYGSQMQAEVDDSAAALLAMGRLQGCLEADQAAERRRFARRFKAFDGAANRSRMRRLFKPRDDGGAVVVGARPVTGDARMVDVEVVGAAEHAAVADHAGDAAPGVDGGIPPRADHVALPAEIRPTTDPALPEASIDSLT